MSRVAPKQAVEVSAAHRTRGTVVLTWSISRVGAEACGLANSTDGPAVRLEIAMPAPGEGPASIQARVLDGARVVPVEGPLGSSRWIEDTIRGVWHLDIEGVLKLTIRRDAERIEALYARTELLARAGIAGGRYEFDGASLRDEAGA